VERCLHNDPDPKRIRCGTCKDGDERISERHGPRHKVVELTGDQWDDFWATHQKLQGTCIYVNPDGEVCDAENYPVLYVCESCEGTLIDEDDISRMSAKQLANVTGRRQVCDHCGHEDYLWGIYGCDHGGRSMKPSEDAAYAEMSPEEREKFLPEDADHWVVRGSMFDKVLEVTVTGTDKKIGDKMVVLKGFNISTGADWSTAEDDLAQFGIEGEAAEKIIEPWDLDERYRPEKSVKIDDMPSKEEWVTEVLAAQAESGSLENPWSNTGSRWGGGSKGGGAKRTFRRS
jgi:hypothetical protein